MNLSRRSVLAGAAALGAGAVTGQAGPARASATATGPYQPTAQSLGTHPVAQWFKDAKFGIFIHWGVYSVPAWGDPLPYQTAEWYSYAMHIPSADPQSAHQHHLQTYGADFNYDQFIPRFTAENYDPRAWIGLFERAGARYFVLTSKHHEGFQLFPNTASDRNSVALGPHRDLVGELFRAAQDSHLKRCLYHSLGEFYNPALGTPPWNPYTQATIPYTGFKPVSDYVSQYLHVLVKTLIDRYDPDLLWADGEHYEGNLGGGSIFRPQDMDWRSDELLAYYYNHALGRPQPKEVMVNDRWEASHADYTVLEGDRSSYALRSGAWEAALTMGRSWGYDTNENPAQIKSGGELVQLLADIVSKNGNLLLNIGPKHDGTIAGWQAGRLLAIGDWLRVNGSAIYGTRPWKRAADGNVRYTTSQTAFNIISLTWPGQTLTVPADVPVASDSQIRLLGDQGHRLDFRRTDAGVEITLPARGPAGGEDYPVVLTVSNAETPVSLTIQPGSAGFAAGKQAQVNAAFTNEADTAWPAKPGVILQAVRLDLATPAGWTVTPSAPQSYDQVAPGQTVQATWDVVPAVGQGNLVTEAQYLDPAVHQEVSALSPPVPVLVSDLVTVLMPAKLAALRAAQVGAEYYVDREFTITSLPAALAGGVLIPGANDDKELTSPADYLQFTLSAPATVYVAFDVRGEASWWPSWLPADGFAATGQTIGITDSTSLAVLEKQEPAGTVTLGPNSATTGNSSAYITIIVPAIST